MTKQKFLNSDGVSTLWEAIKSIVSNINTRIDNLEGLATPVISKTYSELKTLRNNNNLVPGRQYRITDYVTTTAQENTTSAEHQFDIIVTANSTNTFSEVARVIHHAGDTYFANSKLDAWKIWYCFDNDSDRFLWADTTNGKGVIYHMIDEWNNDCPYDFKNIVMEDLSSTLPGGGLYYTFTILYDDGESGRADASLYGYCHNNTIKPTCDFDNAIYTYSLNTNIFISGDVTILHENFLDYGCRNNVFGYNCNSNKLGCNCCDNVFGNNCVYNTFGNECYSNNIGKNCICNRFGNGCSYNSFGSSCSYNSFGNGCIYNSFRISGDNTSSLISYCRYNAFDDGCSFNIIYSTNTKNSTYLENYHINRGVKGTYSNHMLIDAQYLNSENVCNVYKKGDVAVVAYIQY